MSATPLPVPGDESPSALRDRQRAELIDLWADRWHLFWSKDAAAWRLTNCASDGEVYVMDSGEGRPPRHILSLMYDFASTAHVLNQTQRLYAKCSNKLDNMRQAERKRVVATKARNEASR